MNGVDPPSRERRSSERRPPSYTPEEINNLRITRVHFREDFLFCLLSDANVLCVPLTISPAVLAAPRKLRYQWQVTADGRAVVWHTKGMGVTTIHLDLTAILTHPESEITELPGD
jgi:hypothetical protein